MSDRSDHPQPATRFRARRVGVSRSKPGKRRGTPHPHTVAKVITASLAVLALLTGGSVVAVYNHWNSRLLTVPLDDQLKNRPKHHGPKGAMNILVMGSDTRVGEGNDVDGQTDIGERSDTTILLHLSANREFAYGISIPRDTLVDRPTCYDEDGNEIPGGTDALWNEAFSVGGPACTIQQFEQLSGVFVDHYVVLDFGGFKDMVNALGGVEVCIPEDIYDPEHDITLEAGTREIRDDEALAYVRARYTVGDGSDPHRIRRQQAFMASMMNKAVSASMLARPDKLNSFISATIGSITTDYENTAQLGKLGSQFQGVGLNKINFVTTPWGAAPQDPNRIVWTPEVEELWRLVREDQPLTKVFLDESISAADEPDGSETPSGDATPSDQPSEPSTEPTEGTQATDGTGPATGDATDEPAGGESSGLSEEERASVGLCT